MSKWISVKTRLPKPGETVLVWFGGSEFPSIDKAWLRQRAWRNWNWHRDIQIYDWIITHWMPLPKPPKVIRVGGIYKGFSTKEAAEAARKDGSK